MRGRGFTLIELLVVIAIIGILAALIIPSAISSQQRARDAKRKSNIAQIAKAIERYSIDYGKYPDYPNGKTLEQLNADLVPAYLSGSILQSDGKANSYISFDSGKYYSLSWEMESKVASSGNATVQTVATSSYPTTTSVVNLGSEKSNYLFLDGTNDNFIIEDNETFDFTGDFSIMFWAKIEDDEPYTLLSKGYGFGTGYSTTNGWHISAAHNARDVYFQVRGTTGSVSMRTNRGCVDPCATGSPFRSFGWTLFVATKSGNNFKLYSKNASGSSSTSATGNVGSIANSSDIVSSRFYGNPKMSLDDLRFYNRALSDDEVNAIYNNGFGLFMNTLDPNLIAAWRLDSSSGTSEANVVSGMPLIKLYEGNTSTTEANGPNWADGSSSGTVARYGQIFNSYSNAMSGQVFVQSNLPQ